MDGTCKVLTVAEIAEFNRLAIEQSSGMFSAEDRNLLHPGSLEHVLEEIQGSIFAYNPHPTLVEKAAALAWRIIVGHVFHDGNKRTGMLACAALLELNGYSMRIDSMENVRDMALAIAAGVVEFREFVSWLEARTSKLA